MEKTEMPVSIKPLAAKAGDVRYELKYCCPLPLLPDIRAVIRCHRAAFSTAYPQRSVNNIYFDTQDMSNIRDNLAGGSERVKLRLRWYGRLHTVHAANMQLKEKRGELGWKLIIPLKCEIDLRRSDWREIVETIRKAGLGALSERFAHSPLPVLVNSYQREYFVSGDNRIRLTLDTALTYFGQRFSQLPNLTRPEPRQSIAVVELKGAVEDTELLKAAATQIPMFRTAFSKYLVGAVDMGFRV